MKLSEFKKQLEQVESFKIELLNGQFVPNHFHITEMGIINKKYTDCGNTFREENYFTFQLWFSVDTWHQLTSDKVLKIIAGIEKNTIVGDYEILVEYQDKHTIGKYGLEYNGTNFELSPTRTTCLAQDNCGIPAEKVKKNLDQLTSCCTPESGCC